MKLDLNVAEITQLDMTAIRDRIIDGREKIRIREKHESHYRLLKHLGWQFTHELILDIGTRRGTSAICLADNPENTVMTFDIIAESKGYKIPDLFQNCPNVQFTQQAVEFIPDNLLLASPLIFLDIDHSGKSEDKFFTRLKDIEYSGFVFCDDVTFPRKFPELERVFTKHGGIRLPRPISHDTGTGVLLYGPQELVVTQ